MSKKSNKSTIPKVGSIWYCTDPLDLFNKMYVKVTSVNHTPHDILVWQESIPINKKHFPGKYNTRLENFNRTRTKCTNKTIEVLYG